MGHLCDAWEALTFAAGIVSATERVEIGTMVANTGYRNPATLEKCVTPRVCPTHLRPESLDNKPICGSANEIADQIRGFEAMDVSHLPVWLWPNNKASVEAFAPVLEILKQ